jgi:hypothetical protein
MLTRTSSFRPPSRSFPPPQDESTTPVLRVVILLPAVLLLGCGRPNAAHYAALLMGYASPPVGR